MDNRKLKLIAELIAHLEDMDAGELRQGMSKPEPEGMVKPEEGKDPMGVAVEVSSVKPVDGPMDKLLAQKEGEEPKGVVLEDEDMPSDDELDELDSLE